MPKQDAVTSESFELQTETARLMIRAAAIVLSVTAVFGILTLPVMPTPAGPAALAVTLIAVAVAWWQTRRPHPDAFGLLIIWPTLTAIAGSFSKSPVANAQTMSLFAAVFLGVFLLDGRRRWIVLGYSWLVWAWMISRIAPGVDREMIVQIAANHAITLAIGTVLMLTLRRRMGHVIDRAVRRFHALPVGAFRWTADGEILDANERLVAILGYDSVEDLRSRNAEELFVEEGERSHMEARAANDGAVLGAHILLRSKRGAVIEARATLTSTPDSSGGVVLEGTIEDVSALNTATERARVAEERFTAAFESAPIGMLMVGIDGGLLKANDAAEALFGCRADDLQVRVRDWWRSLVLKRGDGQVEHAVARPDGSEIWVRVRSTMLEDTEGPFFVVQLVDVTSQRLLEDSLRAVAEAKDEFIASVSHELRTPLTAVVGFSDMLVNDESLTGDDKVELQRLVHGQALSVSYIVQDLLVAARVDNNQLSVEPSRIDLESIVQSAVADCEHAVGRCPTMQIDGRAEAFADHERVRQIIRNLVTNAARYGGENVGILMSNSGPTARVSVIDDGAGIAPDVVETIWEPYARAHPVSPTTTDSIGLGLAVSLRLANLMDGDLDYRYENGKSVFELTLPAAEAAPSIR